MVWVCNGAMVLSLKPAGSRQAGRGGSKPRRNPGLFKRRRERVQCADYPLNWEAIMWFRRTGIQLLGAVALAASATAQTTPAPPAITRTVVAATKLLILPYLDIPALPFNVIEAVVSTTLGFGLAALLS